MDIYSGLRTAILLATRLEVVTWRNIPTMSVHFAINQYGQQLYSKMFAKEALVEVLRSTVQDHIELALALELCKIIDAYDWTTYYDNL